MKLTMSESAQSLLLLIGGCLFAGTIFTLLASLWYSLNYKQPLDRDTVFVFAKIFYGMGAIAIFFYLFIRYS